MVSPLYIFRRGKRLWFRYLLVIFCHFKIGKQNSQTCLVRFLISEFITICKGCGNRILCLLCNLSLSLQWFTLVIVFCLEHHLLFHRLTGKMGNKASSSTRGETTSLTDSPSMSRKNRKPAKRTLSFGDKPRKKWSKENGQELSIDANLEVRYDLGSVFCRCLRVYSVPHVMFHMYESNLACKHTESSVVG